MRYRVKLWLRQRWAAGVGSVCLVKIVKSLEAANDGPTTVAKRLRDPNPQVRKAFDELLGAIQKAKGNEAREVLRGNQDPHNFPLEAAAEARHIFGFELFDTQLGKKRQRIGY